MTELFHFTKSDIPGRARLRVDADRGVSHRVRAELFGKFCEHLGANIYHGMAAQVLFNPTFGKWRFAAGDGHPDGGVCELTDREAIAARIEQRAQRSGWPSAEPVRKAYFDGGAYGWFAVGRGVRLSPEVGPHGGRAQRVEVAGDGGQSAGIGQWTYLPLHRARRFEVRVVARAVGDACSLRLGLTPAIPAAPGAAAGSGTAANPAAPDHADDGASLAVPLTPAWQSLEGTIDVLGDVSAEGLYLCSLTTAESAHVILDRVLLTPADHIDGADPEIVALLRESGLPLLRWPGGNFVSGYRWRDGVGPADARPTVPNPAWEGLEFNTFGTHEFVDFCRAVGCEPMICVNAGDGTAEEAAAWVQYCNGDTDTPMGALRAEHGHAEPYAIRRWEIGNEIYGRWQVSWTTPAGNVDRARRFADAMRHADPTIQLLGCGQGNEPDSAWNRELIEALGPDLRCITDHILTGGAVDATTDPAELFGAFMGYPRVLETRYRELQARMREAGHPAPRMAITELQLFAHFRAASEGAAGTPTAQAPSPEALSPETMPRPDTLAEALSLALIINTCIRLGDFVELLTHSATVNHGGGLGKARERVWPHPVHHAHAMGRLLAGGTPLPVALHSPAYSTTRDFGHIPPQADVPVLDAMAVRLADDSLALWLVHRGAESGAVELEVEIAGGFAAAGAAATLTLTADAWHARNTWREPDRVCPAAGTVSVREGRLRLTLPPWSLTSVTVPASG